MKSDAKTPKEYLDALPEDRRKVVAAVRKLVNAHIPKGYKEGVGWGMLAWEIPLKRYPDTYNGKPLSCVCLAAQKNHYALYLNGIYVSEERTAALRRAYAAAGKKLDMGKSCLRFKKLDDLVPEAVGDAVAALTVDEFIQAYEAGQRRP